MAMTVKEVRAWLDQFLPEEFIAINDDGMALVDEDNEEIYLEIGGIRIVFDCGGCGANVVRRAYEKTYPEQADPGPAPWHYDDEDCRAINIKEEA
jgi:hypothetical protein